MRIAFGNRLSAQSWAAAAEMLEREIGEALHLVAGDPQLEIDLSEVSFADFTILGRLLILIDSFASRGTEVVVRMPNSDPLDRELPYLNPVPASHRSSDKITLERIGRHRRQRSHCRIFMKQAGFEPAIQRGPWPTNRVRMVEASPRLIEPSERASVSSLSSHFQAYQTPRRARRILPYRWLLPKSA